MSGTRLRATHPTRLLLALLLALPSIGCATREVKDTVVDQHDLVVILREHKKGFEVVPRGFQQPVRISPQRLQNILGAIDVRGREADLAGQQAAFDPDQLPTVAAGLARGLDRASPDQEVVVIAVRKEVQHLIFDRKRITSFVAYAQDGLLYLCFSRVDWEVPEIKTKTSLPEPRTDEHPMKFKVLPAPSMYSEGMYTVSVDWQDPIFQNPLPRAAAEDEGGRRERTILMEAPERAAPRHSALPADLLPYLTPEQLRQLADLEEARQNGSITEGHYRHEREKILEAAQKKLDATSE